ncbi:hypothetical protein THAOC_37078, partial [Thalassiosira oceanica]
MPSRKKAQGRQNRARKEAIRTAELRTLWEPMALCSRSNHVAVPCEHMLTAPPKIPQEGPAVSFMNRMAGEGFFNRATSFPHEQMMSTCFSLSHRFPGVREKDNEHRALVIALLLRFLRNVFVRDSAIEGELWFHQRPQIEAVLCIMIYLLELHGTFSDNELVVRRAAKTSIELMYGNRRDVAKFVAKRLPCTCLKELHRAARTKVVKVGKKVFQSCAILSRRQPAQRKAQCFSRENDFIETTAHELFAGRTHKYRPLPPAFRGAATRAACRQRSVRPEAEQHCLPDVVVHGRAVVPARGAQEGVQLRDRQAAPSYPVPPAAARPQHLPQARLGPRHRPLVVGRRRAVVVSAVAVVVPPPLPGGGALPPPGGLSPLPSVLVPTPDPALPLDQATARGPRE